MKRIVYVILMVVVVMAVLTRCQQSSQSKRAQRAKYVFYFIGDGMGVNQVNATEMYLAEKKGEIGSVSLNFTQFPVVSYATTYSKYNSVTCSAAAGTALATGVKTKNGTIGMDSLRQHPVYSIATQAKKAGKKVGITTNVSIDHATPAAFYAHQPDRNRHYEIALDLPESGFDLYAGAGFLQVKEKQNASSKIIYEKMQDSGYVIIRGMEDFVIQSPKANRIVFMPKGNASPTALTYAIDRTPEELSLAQITECAIDFLSQKENQGFFLMVEGGKIDWACHNNDAATVFHEVIDFAEAIQKAINFYQKHSEETLIVVTADHETGGISLGTGSYALNLKVLEHQRLSMEELTSQIKLLRQAKNNQVSWEDLQNLLKENLGFWTTVQLNEKQERKLKEVYENSFQGENIKLEKQLYSSNEPIAGQAIRILNEIAMIGWSSGGHSAGLVPVYALGVGAQLFQGKMDNTDIPRKIAEAAGY